MATKPQFYQEYQWANSIDSQERQIIRAKSTLASAKTILEQVKAEVDADVDATTDMQTLATQANSLVNNVKYTDLITFLENALGS